MARLSAVVKNAKRKKLINQKKNKRDELKSKIISSTATDTEKFDAMVALQKLPRNSSPIRYRNRCTVTGRSRGYFRSFGLCRNKFRELALQGMIPGVTKASW